MVMVTQAAAERGYQKMLRLPQEKLKLVLDIIDQFSTDVSSEPRIKIGIADGKYHIPTDINQYDDEIAGMFGEAQ